MSLISISNKKLFWSIFFYFSVFGILIVQVFGPVFHLSETMGGGQHDGYFELAANVARGNGFVFEPNGADVIHRPPAYVIALIPGMYLPAQFQRLYVILLNAVFAAGTAVVLRKMALKLSGNPWVATVAVALLVSNPWIIWTVKNPMSAIFQMFLYLLTIFLAMLFIQKKAEGERWRLLSFSTLFGWVCAVACLSHGVMLPISLIVITLIAFRAIQVRENFKLPAVLISLLVLCSIVLPWTLRNYKITGRFIPVVSNSGVAYFGGNAYWGITKPPVQEGETILKATLRHAGISVPPESAFHFWGMKDPAIDQKFECEMVKHIKLHPRPFIKKIILNGLGYYFPILHHLIIPKWSNSNIPDDKKNVFCLNVLEHWFISVYYGVVLFLSMCAVILSNRNNFSLGIGISLFFFVALYAFPYFPFLTFVGHSHYVFGTLPFLYLLTADLLFRLYLRGRLED